MVSTLFVSTAFAIGWDDGGMGVVVFPTSNPAKILFTDRVRPAEANLGYATDRTAYSTALKTSDSSKVRNAYPAGSLPTVDFNPQRAGVDYTRLTIAGPLVWSNVSKSGPVFCGVDEKNCAQPGQIASSTNCSYNRVKTIATGEISGGVAKDVKVKNASFGVDVGGGLSLTREWESGWEACTTEGSSHSCPPDQNLSFNAVNYATTEARSRFGWQRFVTSGSIFYFNKRYSAQDVTFCETTIGGNYVSGGYVFEPKVGRCEVYSGRKKPTWERYERLPITNGAANPTIVGQCRTIKQV